MEDMSTLRSVLGTTVCSDFSESIEDYNVAYDSFEQLFDESSQDKNVVKTDRDSFGQHGELYQKVLFEA